MDQVEEEIKSAENRQQWYAEMKDTKGVEIVGNWLSELYCEHYFIHMFQLEIAG